MSILTELLHKTITWDQAKAKIEAWGSHLISSNGIATAVAGAVVTDLKQAASDAIATADTLAGPLIATGAAAVSAAFDIAVKGYLGPFGAVVSPAAHDGIDKIAAGLKAEIDALVVEAKAALASPAPLPPQ